MTKIRIASAVIMAVMALALFTSVASAQATPPPVGVTVFTGRVTIDGDAAPAGTPVEVVRADGSVLATGDTGDGDLDDDQYRIDAQSYRANAGETITLRVMGLTSETPATVTFAGNRVLTADITTGLTPTLVSIAPSAQEVRGGETFTVDIQVDPAQAIAGAQFDLSFDPTRMEAVRVDEGNLLSQGGANTFFQAGQLDNTNGMVAGTAGVITSPGTSVAQEGALATVEFQVKEGVLGCALLELSDVVVGDISGSSVAVELAGNGQAVIQIGSLPGDLNGDWRVNVTDLRQAASFFELVEVARYFGMAENCGGQD